MSDLGRSEGSYEFVPRGPFIVVLLGWGVLYKELQLVVVTNLIGEAIQEILQFLSKEILQRSLHQKYYVLSCSCAQDYCLLP